MNNGNGTIMKRLAAFGLTEKEAQLYLHLLRFGPKQPTELRKSLKTYREDIHRRLTGLIAKSMIGKGVDNASLYIAADLDTALNAQLLTRHHELQQLEAAKRELEELVKGQRLMATDDYSTDELSHVTNNEDASVSRLAAFGLTEKEAQLYLHLLREGPQRPIALINALKTYREDVYRRCTSLVAKGMVRKSSTELYIAADLDTALNAQLLTRHHELQQLEAVKRELEELLEGQQFRIADDVFTYKILKTVREVVTSVSQLIRSAETQIAIIAPPRTLNLIFMVGSHDQQKRAVERGVRVRVITDVSRRNIEMIRDHLDLGVALRHINHYRGITGIVADGKQSISLIHADPEASLSLDEHVTMLWSDSPEHAIHLMETFEMAWEHAIDADEQIRALARQERPSVGSTMVTN